MRVLCIALVLLPSLVAAQSPAPTFAELDSRCRTLLDAAACRKAAGRAATGKGGAGAPDLAKAREYLSHGCYSLSDPASCGTLAVWLLGTAGGPANVVAARDIGRRACEGGDPSGCLAMAEAERSGKGGPVDEGAARADYTKACAKGDATACESLHAMEAGPAAALAQLESVCAQKGFRIACYEAANVYDARPGSDDKAKARALFQRGCDLGDPDACAMLASQLRHGTAGPTDAGQARTLDEKACSDGSALACVAVGEDAELAHDAARAAKAFAGACTQRNARGCYGKARLARAAATTSNERYQAGRDFRYACDYGLAVACVAVAENARELTIDDAAATDYVRRGCERAQAGEGRVCELYGERLAKGQGATPDATAARTAFQKACGLGATAACERARALGGP